MSAERESLPGPPYRHQRVARVTSVGPHQVREGREVSFCQVSSMVVEMALKHGESRIDPSCEGMPVHLQGESLRGEGLEGGQIRQLQSFFRVHPRVMQHPAWSGTVRSLQPCILRYVLC